jgi:hypothetical protein
VAFESSQGITFTFGGAANVYQATAITISESRGEVDSATVNQAYGSTRGFGTSGLVEYTFKVDWIGTRAPETKKTAVLTISGTTAFLSTTAISGGGIKLNGSGHTATAFQGTAICTGLSHTTSVGDLLKGSATFKVSRS